MTSDDQPFQLNLTKTMDVPADYVLLGDQLKTVDEHFKDASPQHVARRWEYAMCLRALQAWRVVQPVAVTGKVIGIDVGGAGSPLAPMLKDQEVLLKVVDPKGAEGSQASTIEDYARTLYQERQRPHPVVTCISVIEHVKDEHRNNFLAALAAVTASGGLLFLTMDCWGKGRGEKDTAMFHWMRERIYTVETWQDLAREMMKRGFVLFGAPDWSYHGNHVENAYSFCSLSLQKGP